MMNLPKSTEVGRTVPKERFYEKESSTTKDYFVKNIEKIIWANKISPTTLNISSKTYPELQVFKIYIKSIDKKIKDIVRLMDGKIPYPVLFSIICKNEVKSIIAAKQVKEEKIVVIEQFENDWQELKDFVLHLKGNRVDSIYENYMYQIEPDLQIGGSFEENLTKYKQIKSLKAEIEKINRKIKKELSIDKKQELARSRNELENRIKRMLLS